MVLKIIKELVLYLKQYRSLIGATVAVAYVNGEVKHGVITDDHQLGVLTIESEGKTIHVHYYRENSDIIDFKIEKTIIQNEIVWITDLNLIAICIAGKCVAKVSSEKLDKKETTEGIWLNGILFKGDFTKITTISETFNKKYIN